MTSATVQELSPTANIFSSVESESASIGSAISSSQLVVKVDASLLPRLKKLSELRGIDTRTYAKELLTDLTDAVDKDKSAKIKKVTKSKLIAGQFDNIDIDNNKLKNQLIDIKVLGTPSCADSLNDYLHPNKIDSIIETASQHGTSEVLSTLFNSHSEPLSLSSIEDRFRSSNLVLNSSMLQRRIELLKNGNLRLQSVPTIQINSASPESTDAKDVSVVTATKEFNPRLTTRKIVIEGDTPSLMTIQNIITQTAEATAEASSKKIKRSWFNFDIKFFSPDVKINGDEETSTFKQSCIKFVKSTGGTVLRGITALCIVTGILTTALEYGHSKTDKIPGASAAIEMVASKFKNGPVELSFSTDGVSLKMSSVDDKDKDPGPSIEKETPKVDKKVNSKTNTSDSAQLLENEILLRTHFYQSMANWNSQDSRSINNLKYITIAVDNIQQVHKLAGQPDFVTPADLNEAHTRLDSLSKTKEILITPK